jgi:AcrR family transcriptional regulator
VYDRIVNESDRAPRRRLGEAQRRTALLEAARHAFDAAEYSQVSVAQIARAAGASEALAHRYFGSKAGLYAAMVEHALGQLLERHREAEAALGPAADGWARARTGLHVYLDFVAEGPNGWSALMRSPGSVPATALAVREEGRRAYRRLVAGMFALPEDDPAVVIALDGYLGLVESACLAWLADGGRDGMRPVVVDVAVAALTGALHTVSPGLPGPDAA